MKQLMLSLHALVVSGGLAAAPNTILEMVKVTSVEAACLVHGAQVWDSLHGFAKSVDIQSPAFASHSSMDHASFGSSLVSHSQVENMGNH